MSGIGRLRKQQIDACNQVNPIIADGTGPPTKSQMAAAQHIKSAQSEAALSEMVVSTASRTSVDDVDKNLKPFSTNDVLAVGASLGIQGQVIQASDSAQMVVQAHETSQSSGQDIQQTSSSYEARIGTGHALRGSLSQSYSSHIEDISQVHSDRAHSPPSAYSPLSSVSHIAPPPVTEAAQQYSYVPHELPVRVIEDSLPEHRDYVPSNLKTPGSGRDGLRRLKAARRFQQERDGDASSSSSIALWQSQAESDSTAQVRRPQLPALWLTQDAARQQNDTQRLGDGEIDAAPTDDDLATSLQETAQNAADITDDASVSDVETADLQPEKAGAGAAPHGEISPSSMQMSNSQMADADLAGRVKEEDSPSDIAVVKTQQSTSSSPNNDAIVLSTSYFEMVPADSASHETQAVNNDRQDSAAVILSAKSKDSDTADDSGELGTDTNARDFAIELSEEETISFRPVFEISQAESEAQGVHHGGDEEGSPRTMPANLESVFAAQVESSAGRDPVGEQREQTGTPEQTPQLTSPPLRSNLRKGNTPRSKSKKRRVTFHFENPHLPVPEKENTKCEQEYSFVQRAWHDITSKRKGRKRQRTMSAPEVPTAGQLRMTPLQGNSSDAAFDEMPALLRSSSGSISTLREIDSNFSPMIGSSRLQANETDKLSELQSTSATEKSPSSHNDKSGEENVRPATGHGSDKGKMVEPVGTWSVLETEGDGENEQVSGSKTNAE